MANLVPYAARDTEHLVAFFCESEWPLTGKARPTRQDVETWLRQGRFAPPDNVAFWLMHEEQRQGLIVLREMQDDIPIIDVRIAASRRHQGLGKQALRGIAAYTFNETPKLRIEAHTRADNIAMRSALIACGWAKEGHHRHAWRNEDGSRSDNVTYALLKEDWGSGDVTLVNWDDEKDLVKKYGGRR